MEGFRACRVPEVADIAILTGYLVSLDSKLCLGTHANRQGQSPEGIPVMAKNVGVRIGADNVYSDASNSITVYGSAAITLSTSVLISSIAVWLFVRT